MDPQAQALLQKLAAAKAAGQPLPPQLEQVYQEAVRRGLIPDVNSQAADPRSMVANALRPKDFRPVERNDQGAFTPPMDPSGNIASHRYGGTMSSGVEGVPPSTVSPADLATHYAEQMALEEARQPIGNTSISGGNRITAPADTEVRPWAQRTPAGYKERGLDPKGAPLQPVRRERGAPLVQTSPAGMSDEMILRMLMGQ